MKVGHVPLIAYQRPGAPEAAEEVAKLIARYGENGRPIRAVMLAAPGPQRLARHAGSGDGRAGRTGRDRAAVAARARRMPTPLTEPQIDELRRTFGARW